MLLLRIPPRSLLRPQHPLIVRPQCAIVPKSLCLQCGAVKHTPLPHWSLTHCMHSSCVGFVQVYLFWGKDMPELWEELDPNFLQTLRRRWTDNQQRTKRSSLSHLEVSQVGLEPPPPPRGRACYRGRCLRRWACLVSDRLVSEALRQRACVTRWTGGGWVGARVEESEALKSASLYVPLHA